jgi:hypothetical protein
MTLTAKPGKGNWKRQLHTIGTMGNAESKFQAERCLAARLLPINCDNVIMNNVDAMRAVAAFLIYLCSKIADLQVENQIMKSFVLDAVVQSNWKQWHTDTHVTSPLKLKPTNGSKPYKSWSCVRDSSLSRHSHWRRSMKQKPKQTRSSYASWACLKQNYI